MFVRRRRAAHPHLSADRVRDEAIRLIESEGLAEFSTRKLGRALGVEAMAIYWYYPSKDALLDAVVDWLLARFDVSPFDGEGSFIDAMRALAYAHRRLAREFPKCFPLLATRRFAVRAPYARLEVLFACAHRQGIDDRTAARWLRIVTSYCNGIALDEIAALRDGEATDTAAATLAAEYPRLAAASDWLGAESSDDVFARGLEVLLDALAAEARTHLAQVSTRVR